MIFAIELPPSRPIEDLSEVLQAEADVAQPIETLDDERDPFLATNRADLRCGNLVLAEHLAGKTKRKVLVLDEGRLVGPVEFRDVGRRLVEFLGGLEALFAAIDQPLLLHAGQGTAGRGRCLLNRVGVGERMDVRTVLRKDADRPDTVCTIV